MPPKDSTILCSICKVSPSCVALCSARIYYVVGSESMTRACIHFGIHAHPVKIGDYRDSIEHTTSFLSEQIQSTPTATNSALVLEASKDLGGDMILAPKGSVSTKLYSHLFCLKINPRDLIKLNKDFNEVGDKGKLMAP